MPNPYNLTLTAASWQKISGPWNACEDHVVAVKAGLGVKSITALQVIEMPGQTDKDAVFRALWLLARTDRRTAVYLAKKAAEHVLPIFEAKRPADKRPRECLRTIKRWLAGKATETELRTAYASARDDAYVAAYAAAFVAAYAAADVAAFAAADAAACAAADAAAERKWQRAMITRELRKLRDGLRGGA